MATVAFMAILVVVGTFVTNRSVEQLQHSLIRIRLFDVVPPLLDELVEAPIATVVVVRESNVAPCQVGWTHRVAVTA